MDKLPAWDSFINKPTSSGSSSELAEKFMENGVKFLKVNYFSIFIIKDYVFDFSL